MTPTTDDPDQLFEQAIASHRAGELEKAARLYAKILEQQPRHVPSLHMSGVIALQSGDPALAIQRISRAATLAPHQSQILSNLASAQIALHRYEEARL